MILNLIVPSKPSVVFRQAPNLRRKLVKSNLRVLPFPNLEDVEVEEPGCYKFNHPARGRKCETCPVLNVSKTFSSSYTKRVYKMRHHLHCKSSWVIYLVTCRRPGCTAQYCGSTSTLMMRRHAGHRQELRERTSPLGRHFSDCGYQNFSLQIIDCVKEGEEEGLGRLEGFWQNNLATFEETGSINRRDEMTVRRN